MERGWQGRGCEATMDDVRQRVRSRPMCCVEVVPDGAGWAAQLGVAEHTEDS